MVRKSIVDSPWSIVDANFDYGEEVHSPWSIVAANFDYGEEVHSPWSIVAANFDYGEEVHSRWSIVAANFDYGLWTMDHRLLYHLINNNGLRFILQHHFADPFALE